MPKQKKSNLGKKHSPSYEMLRSMFSNKLTMICLIFVLCLLFLAIFADVIFDYDTQIIAQDIPNKLQRPSAVHWFGTDSFGRDYFARTLYATRITMIIALSSAAIGTLIGLAIGAFSAYCGGIVDTVIMRVLDIIVSVPALLICICIVAVLGGSVPNLIAALAFSSIPGVARIVRAEIMTTMENEYVEAARACGASGFRIVLSHLIPNILGPVIVNATMFISAAIISTAGLGYLGMGVPAPAPEWGAMLSEAQEYMRKYLYMIIVPGVAIVMSSVAFNLLGDGLRDAMDPRLRGFRKAKKKRKPKKTLPESANAAKDHAAPAGGDADA